MVLTGKRILPALLAVILIVSLAACGGGSAAQSNLTGTAEEVLTKLTEDIAAADVQTPMTLPPMAVTAELSQNTIGLSEADFDKYVASASSSLAAIGTFAHQMAVIEAKDSAAAAEVKKLVSGENGYNPEKWICVLPEKAVAVESGSYVLLVAAASDVCDAAVGAFQDAAGNIGEVNTFWESAR